MIFLAIFRQKIFGTDIRRLFSVDHFLCVVHPRPARAKRADKSCQGVYNVPSAFGRSPPRGARPVRVFERATHLRGRRMRIEGGIYIRGFILGHVISVGPTGEPVLEDSCRLAARSRRSFLCRCFSADRPRQNSRTART